MVLLYVVRLYGRGERKSHTKSRIKDRLTLLSHARLHPTTLDFNYLRRLCHYHHDPPDCRYHHYPPSRSGRILWWPNFGGGSSLCAGTTSTKAVDLRFNYEKDFIVAVFSVVVAVVCSWWYHLVTDDATICLGGYRWTRRRIVRRHGFFYDNVNHPTTSTQQAQEETRGGR